MRSTLEMLVIYVVTGFGALALIAAPETTSTRSFVRRLATWPLLVAEWLNQIPLYRPGRAQLVAASTYALCAAIMDARLWATNQTTALLALGLTGLVAVPAAMLATVDPPETLTPPRDRYQWHWAAVLFVSVWGATGAFTWAPGWPVAWSMATVAWAMGWPLLICGNYTLRARLPYAPAHNAKR